VSQTPALAAMADAVIDLDALMMMKKKASAASQGELPPFEPTAVSSEWKAPAV
jgi:hypothetical protein